MADHGSPSRVRLDDEEDKHIILTEQPRTGPVMEHVDEDPVEDRMISSEDEAGQEEESEEGEPAEYQDDMGTTADDIIEELTSRNEELEERVHQLEEQNQAHQDLELQYRDVAYRALGESAEVREWQQFVRQRIAELEEVVRQKDQRIAELQAQLIAMTVESDRDRMDRENLHEAWLRAAMKVDEMEVEYRACEARVDRANRALTTAFGRLRSRIRRYGRERRQGQRRISRRVVDQIAQQEYEEAALRANR